MTDEAVLRAVMVGGAHTRAELAVETGLSKPTASESVRRLTEAGLLRDTGERTTGRGRVGTYYSLSPECGLALAVTIDPAAVVAEAVDPFGDVVARAEETLSPGASRESVATALTTVAKGVTAGLAGPVRSVVVGAADPVDRESGRLVHLPEMPFLVGDLDPVAVLSPFVAGQVLVDNDVNWSARAELAAAPAAGDVLLLHLGEGLGGAVVSDGEVRRGGHGLAGEVAHVVTVGPGGRAMPFTRVFAELGLRRAGSTAVDVELLLGRVDAGGSAAEELLGDLAAAVGGVVAAAVGLLDPREVLLGGPWGSHPAVLAAVASECAGSDRPVPIRAAQVADPVLTGVRAHAVEELRRLVIAER